MSGWIKVDKELTETIRFKRMLKVYRNALRGVTESDVTRDKTTLLGALVSLWMYADSHIRDDNTLGITLDEIDEIVGVEGFAKSVPCEWLVVLDSERVELPDFLEHNGTSARLRKNNAKRQANHRWKKKQLGVTRDVTHRNASNDARPDQTRPEETRERERAHVIDFGNALTKTSADPPDEDSWIEVGCDPQAMRDWIGHRAKNGKALPGHAQYAAAKMLLGMGSPETQRQAVQLAISNNWQSLRLTDGQPSRKSASVSDRISYRPTE